MGENGSVPADEMLRLLEPALVRGTRAPPVGGHRVVPARVRAVRGRTQLRPGAVGGHRQRARPIVSRTALEVNLLTEDNLPYYHLALWDMFGRGRRLGRVGPPVDRRGGPPRDRAPRLPDRDARDSTRWRSSAGGWTRSCAATTRTATGQTLDPLDGVVYTTLQELATRIAHRNTGAFTQDPLIEKLTARIATDENLHYVFYRELGKAALEIDPSAMMLAINRQVTGFAMPGPGHARASRRRRSRSPRPGSTTCGSITTRSSCRSCSLTGRSTQLTGLSQEAEEARDGIANYLQMLEAMASHYEEKRAARETAEG